MGAVIVYRRYLKLNADVIGRRTARANSVATKRLKTARAYLNAHNTEKYHEALAAALWGYISDKLRIPASALTRDNISEQMYKAGFDGDLINSTIKVLDDCEMARFTPDGGDSHSSQLYDETSSLIGQLESFKRKNRQ